MRLLPLLLVVVAAATSTAMGQTILEDDFDRPDGPVGNGWSTWWDGAFEDPNIEIVDGELKTVGFLLTAGGVFRELPVTLPVFFRFDFRTLNEEAECHASLPYNDGGWTMKFNTDISSAPTPTEAQGMLRFWQNAGSRNLERCYRVNEQSFCDLQPDLPEPIANQRDYSTDPVHIEGTVAADLSTVVRVYYGDGQIPDPVEFVFGPVTGTLTSPGVELVWGNTNCSSGPHFFDRLEIRACSQCPDGEHDVECDGVCSGSDNCPDAYNADQADSDGDGVGDECDVLEVPALSKGWPWLLALGLIFGLMVVVVRRFRLHSPSN